MKLLNLSVVLILCIINIFAINVSPAHAVCVGGSCAGSSIAPERGIVGSRVVMTISHSSPQSELNYHILWSKSNNFAGAEIQLIKEGVIYGGTTLTQVEITVPESDNGVHYIQFKPDSEISPTTFQFSVSSGLQVTPSSVYSGSEVTVKGNGFLAYDVVIFRFDSQFVNTQVTTNGEGSFNCRLMVPELLAGQHVLWAMSQSNGISSFEHIEILPAVKTVEDDVNENKQADNTGQPETYTINYLPVEPESNTIIPDMPTPVSPMGGRVGMWGPEQIVFQWNHPDDKDDVTFILEVNTDHNFVNAPVIKGSQLTSSSCIVSLDPGTYYWRVKAIDSQGNESHWSCAQRGFTVGELSVAVDEVTELINSNSDSIQPALIVLGVILLIVIVVPMFR